MAVWIKSDQTVELVNIPSIMTSKGSGHDGFLSAKGTWEIDGQGLCIHIDSGELPSAFYASGFLDFRRHRGSVILVSTLGDPDSGDTLTFEKR
jgi:hypothetical protein